MPVVVSSQLIARPQMPPLLPIQLSVWVLVSGISVPGAATDPERYEKRFDFLTSDAMRNYFRRRYSPGNIVIAHIASGQARNVLTVPPQVVQKFADGSLFDWIVDPVRHTAVQQVIEAGSLNNSEVEIASGLKAGDQVIRNVPQTLFEGTPLKTTTAP